MIKEKNDYKERKIFKENVLNVRTADRRNINKAKHMF